MHIINLAAASHDQLVYDLRGVYVVVSTVIPFELSLQKSLANAAKEADVKSFIPSDWAKPCVRGEMQIHDMVQILDNFYRLDK